MNEPSYHANIGDRGVRTAEQALRYLHEKFTESYSKLGFGLYAVWTRDEPAACAGICGLLRRPGFEDIELGFAFLPEHWGKGYATEAGAASIEHAARDFGARRIIAITSPGNLASIRVLERLGFAFEAMTRHPGSAEDLKLFSRALPGAAGEPEAP